jgi:hypothetical protein
VAITVGKKTPKRIVATFEPSPIPNQMMNSGKSAIFGIGNRAETSGDTGAGEGEQPMACRRRRPRRPAELQPTAAAESADRCARDAGLDQVGHGADCLRRCGQGELEMKPVCEPISHSDDEHDEQDRCR